MIIQVITYQTQNPLLEEFQNSILEMKGVYMTNGCTRYEVLQDKDNPEQFIEIACFETSYAAEAFETLDTPEKREAFNKFCSTGKVIGESVKVITGKKLV
jgi:hypothetical protein